MASFSSRNQSTAVVPAKREAIWAVLADPENVPEERSHAHFVYVGFELVKVADRPTSGVWKDVVVVPPWKQVEIDVVTTSAPGLTLFHCHQQFHMDMGFMAMMEYGR